MDSPFLRKNIGVYSSGKKKARLATEVKCVAVRATSDVPNAEEGGHDGFCFYFTGFTNKAFTDPMHKKNKDPAAAHFLDLIAPMRWTFPLHELAPTPEDPCHIEPITNDAGYPVKGFCWVQDKATKPKDKVTFDADYCKEFYEKCLSPAFRNFATELNERDFPEWNDDSYKTVSCWSELIHEDQFRHILKDLGVKNEANFFKESMNNIYSFWHEGKVPTHIKTRYKLADSHLLPKDKLRAVVQPEDNDGEQKQAALSTPRK